jgi:hypothetical protein
MTPDALIIMPQGGQSMAPPPRHLGSGRRRQFNPFDLTAPAAWRCSLRSRRAASWLSSLADERWLVDTNTPSVPGQRETNDTGLGATSKVDNHNGGWMAR